MIRFLIRCARKRSSVLAFALALTARMFRERCGVVLNLNNFGVLDGRQVAQTEGYVLYWFVGK